MAGPLPVTIVGGYLGAGKTTLVNHLLRHADGRRLAILVNDFGELPIDVDLIEQRGAGVIGIAGGCVCCAYGSDMMGALDDLLALSPRPEHVLIECSGVALPGAVAAAIQLLSSFRLDAVIVLADAETVRSHAADRYMGDTIARQLAAADLLVLNKADLVADNTLAATSAWVAGLLAPATPIIPVRQSALPVDIVLGPQAAGAARLVLAPPQPHDPSAWDRWQTELHGPVDADRLAAALAAPELGLARAKGMVTDRSGGRRLIQVVGRRWSVTPLPDTDGPGRLIAIAAGQPIPRAALARAIGAAGG
ncbi:G3E family GTPase [Stella humosa]|uniref:G3E family GTPase n=1 Tax=Stella humosa TaxID=94 RepID=A0A3N1KHG1_9PROT|nr:GTP-binding protein [Stella humosa]ROP81013.1 G3E family GTPase [Stella humosa]BBK29703.1 cobalamin biosynthesis protein CobW [Stella humosa]